jgi:hypothetical protein
MSSCGCGLSDCPQCGLHTANSAGKRCIPCGWGLVPPGQELSTEQARRSALYNSGGAIDGSSCRGKKGH